jgi:hypothetical protein
VKFSGAAVCEAVVAFSPDVRLVAIFPPHVPPTHNHWGAPGVSETIRFTEARKQPGSHGRATPASLPRFASARGRALCSPASVQRAHRHLHNDRERHGSMLPEVSPGVVAPKAEWRVDEKLES